MDRRSGRASDMRARGHTPEAASPTITIAATANPAAVHAKGRTRGAAATGDGSAMGSRIASSISSRASPMSRSRRFGSFSRQRASRRLIGAGVVAGSAVQSGSRVRTAARTSLIVSPPKRPAHRASRRGQAERPDVRALVYRLAPRLLRRHVGGRAENHAALVSAAGLVNVGELSASGLARPARPLARGRNPAPSPCRRRAA